MLMEWLRGKSESEPAVAEKPARRKTLDVNPETPLEPSPMDADTRREDAFRKKLSASGKEGPLSPAKLVCYDTMFRGVQRLLLEGSNAEVQEGLSLNLIRNAQNVMVSSKCAIISPQMSHWEVNLQMNGFSDIVVASYNTLSRWSLMYQRVCSSGALLLAQCMAQRQQGMTQGTVVGMLQYPWVHGGCTQVQYVKGQSFALSHVQRIIRGVHFGSNLAWDVITRGTALSHAISFNNQAKTGYFVAECSPGKGEWKVALTRKDWARDAEFCMQLDYAQKGGSGMVSLLSFGIRKHFIGGGLITTALSGFSVVKAAVQFPFGGERRGFNQLHCTYNAQYDIPSGVLRHGLVFTA